MALYSTARNIAVSTAAQLRQSCLIVISFIYAAALYCYIHMRRATITLRANDGNGGTRPRPHHHHIAQIHVQFRTNSFAYTRTPTDRRTEARVSYRHRTCCCCCYCWLFFCCCCCYCAAIAWWWWWLVLLRVYFCGRFMPNKHIEAICSPVCVWVVSFEFLARFLFLLFLVFSNLFFHYYVVRRRTVFCVYVPCTRACVWVFLPQAAEVTAAHPIHPTFTDTNNTRQKGKQQQQQHNFKKVYL